ncbi:MAG TPA: TonB-dependent hemoglobin/transferrin/lactoferrin family receptor [Rhizomicrobium sp.]
MAALETVTISATRNPTSTLNYSGMVDVLDAEDISAAIPSTISDLVKTIPNVQFVGGPRRTSESPNIRGLGGEDVLVLIDGVRQSWTSGHDGRFFLDPALLSSMEVVRGPASALYGSGALGGVMAFRTADASDFLAPGQTFGARVALGYQDVDEEFLRTVTGFTHIGNFDLIGSIGQRSSGDIRLGSGATLAADDDIVTGFAKAGYDFGGGLSAKLSYQGFKNEAVEPANGSGLSSGAPVNKTVVSQQFTGQINWKPEGFSLIDLHLTPYHVQTSVEEADPTTGERTFRDIKTNGLSLDNRTSFSFANVSGLFTVGGDWYEDDQVGRDTLAPGGVRSGVPNGSDSFWGMFAQIEANIDRPLGAPGKLTLVPAIRYDSYSTSSTGNPDTDETSVSPKFAATYAPVNWLFAFGNVGKAFRAPGVNSLYLNGIHFSVPHPILPGVSVANTFQPNPTLKPETSHYWEAGAGVVFADLISAGDSLTAKASYWEQSVDDYISLNVFTPATFYAPGCFTPPTFLAGCNVGYTTSQNVNAQLSGAELQAAYDGERVRLEVDYGTMTGHERGTPYDLNSLMPDIVTTVATLKLPEAEALLNARVTVAESFKRSYNPVSNDPASETREGYTLLDLYATWAPRELLGGKLKGLRVDFGVDNVTDEDYTPYAAGVSAAGRNVKVLASYTLGW